MFRLYYVGDNLILFYLCVFVKNMIVLFCFFFIMIGFLFICFSFYFSGFLRDREKVKNSWVCREVGKYN